MWQRLLCSVDATNICRPSWDLLAGAVVYARPHSGRCCSPGSLSMTSATFPSELGSLLSSLYSIYQHDAGAAAQAP